MTKKLKYLLIDDEEVFNFIHSQIIRLTDEFAEINEVRSSSEALEVIQNNASSKENFPDILFIDINMPEMNGFELLTQLQQLAPTFPKPIEIYIVTSSLFESDRLKAKTYPIVTGFIEKPVSNQQVRDIITKKASA
ncbi:MAG: response regulator [Bacteroidetes bacterium]|nr:response regulator [Bacteroidota bacterium]